MVEENDSEEEGREAEGGGPTEKGSHRDDQPRPGHHGDAVGHGPGSYVEGLLACLKPFHVVTVDGDVVCGREGGADEEEEGDDLDRAGQESGEGGEEEQPYQKQLGEEDPLSLGCGGVDLGRPEKLEDPRQAVEGCESDGFQGDLHVPEEDRGDTPDDRVRKTFGEVCREGPETVVERGTFVFSHVGGQRGL